MKVIFFCGHESLFGRQCLDALLTSDLKPSILVVGNSNTWRQFDKDLNNAHSPSFRRRLRKLYYRWESRKWLKRIVRANDLQLEVIEDINAEIAKEKLRKYNADLFICAAYPQIGKRAWLNLSRFGAIGFHPSLLPAFRGAHPHFWAIRKGVTETGISAYRMTERIDDGEIVAQIKFDITELNYGQLYKLLGKNLPKLISRLSGVLLNKQAIELFNDNVSPSYFYNNQLKDSRILWKHQLIEEIDCVIRTGIAWCVYQTRVLRILDGKIFKELEGAPSDYPIGRIYYLAERRLIVRCKDGWLEVLNWKWKYSFFKPNLKGSLF